MRPFYLNNECTYAVEKVSLYWIGPRTYIFKITKELAWKCDIYFVLCVRNTENLNFHYTYHNYHTHFQERSIGFTWLMVLASDDDKINFF